MYFSINLRSLIPMYRTKLTIAFHVSNVYLIRCVSICYLAFKVKSTFKVSRSSSMKESKYVRRTKCPKISHNIAVLYSRNIRLKSDILKNVMIAECFSRVESPLHIYE